MTDPEVLTLIYTAHRIAWGGKARSEENRRDMAKRFTALLHAWLAERGCKDPELYVTVDFNGAAVTIGLDHTQIQSDRFIWFAQVDAWARSGESPESFALWWLWRCRVPGASKTGAGAGLWGTTSVVGEA